MSYNLLSHICQWCKGKSIIRYSVQGTYLSHLTELGESKDHCLIQGIHYTLKDNSNSVYKRALKHKTFTMHSLGDCASQIHYETGSLICCSTCETATMYCEQISCSTVKSAHVCIPQVVVRQFSFQGGNKSQINITDPQAEDQSWFQQKYIPKSYFIAIALLTCKGMRTILDLTDLPIVDEIWSIIFKDYLGLNCFYPLCWMDKRRELAGWKCPHCDAGYVWSAEYVSDQVRLSSESDQQEEE